MVAAPTVEREGVRAPVAENRRTMQAIRPPALGRMRKEEGGCLQWRHEAAARRPPYLQPFVRHAGQRRRRPERLYPYSLSLTAGEYLAGHTKSAGADEK